LTPPGQIDWGRAQRKKENKYLEKPWEEYYNNKAKVSFY